LHGARRISMQRFAKIFLEPWLSERRSHAKFIYLFSLFISIYQPAHIAYTCNVMKVIKVSSVASVTRWHRFLDTAACRLNSRFHVFITIKMSLSITQKHMVQDIHSTARWTAVFSRPIRQPFWASLAGTYDQLTLAPNGAHRTTAEARPNGSQPTDDVNPTRAKYHACNACLDYTAIYNQCYSLSLDIHLLSHNSLKYANLNPNLIR